MFVLYVILMKIDSFKQNQDLVKRKRTNGVFYQDICSCVRQSSQSRTASFARNTIIDTLLRKYQLRASPNLSCLFKKQSGVDSPICLHARSKVRKWICFDPDRSKRS